MFQNRTYAPSRRTFLRALAGSALLLPLGFGPLVARSAAAGSLRILAATYPAYLATLTVTSGLPGIELDLLVAAQTGCPHDYAMSPQDRMKLERADVLVLNGGGFEAFLDERLLAGLGAEVVDAGAGLPDLAARPSLCGSACTEDHHHHGHGAHNPHYFANPACFAHMADTVARAIARREPALADGVAQRARALADGAKVLMDELAGLEGADSVRLVLQHDTLSWFFRDTPFVIEAVLQQEEDEAPSAAVLLELAGHMKEGGRHLLVGEPQFPGQILDTLARETGADRIVLDSVASGPLDAGPDYYLKVMRQNIDTLRAGLAGAPASGR